MRVCMKLSMDEYQDTSLPNEKDKCVKGSKQKKKQFHDFRILLPAFEASIESRIVVSKSCLWLIENFPQQFNGSSCRKPKFKRNVMLNVKRKGKNVDYFVRFGTAQYSTQYSNAKYTMIWVFNQNFENTISFGLTIWHICVIHLFCQHCNFEKVHKDVLWNFLLLIHPNKTVYTFS